MVTETLPETQAAPVVEETPPAATEPPVADPPAAAPAPAAASLSGEESPDGNPPAPAKEPSGDEPPAAPPAPVVRSLAEIATDMRAGKDVPYSEAQRVNAEVERIQAVETRQREAAQAIATAFDALPTALTAIQSRYATSDFGDPNVQAAYDREIADAVQDARGKAEPHFASQYGTEVTNRLLEHAPVDLSGVKTFADAVDLAVGIGHDLAAQEIASLKAENESLKTSLAAKDAELVAANPELASASVGTGNGTAGGGGYSSLDALTQARAEGKIPDDAHFLAEQNRLLGFSS